MKNFVLTLIAILLVPAVNAFAQSDSDFIVIDEIADDITSLISEFGDQSNVFVTEGFSPNALVQIANSIVQLQIEDLHIYALTKPGAIVFNSIAVTPDNEDEWSSDLKDWGRNVTNKVVIHSEVVFTGEEGSLLKQRLETITGLVFTTL
jgi:hypothetical protein